jgi:hypothetical protein
MVAATALKDRSGALADRDQVPNGDVLDLDVRIDAVLRENRCGSPAPADAPARRGENRFEDACNGRDAATARHASPAPPSSNLSPRFKANTPCAEPEVLPLREELGIGVVPWSHSGWDS